MAYTYATLSYFKVSHMHYIHLYPQSYGKVFIHTIPHSRTAGYSYTLYTHFHLYTHTSIYTTQSYGKVFIHKVEHRHTLARNYFSRLPGMTEILERATSNTEGYVLGNAACPSNLSPPYCL